jgi:hypothetical protein
VGGLISAPPLSLRGAEIKGFGGKVSKNIFILIFNEIQLRLAHRG